MTTQPEPSFIGGLPEDRITVTAEHEIAATDPEAEAGWRESMAEAFLYGTFDPAPDTPEAEAFAEMGAYSRAEAERVAALDEADAAYAAAHSGDPVPEPDLEAEPW